MKDRQTASKGELTMQMDNDIAGSTVFVVDDNPSNLWVSTNYLVEFSFTAVPLRSGEELLELVKKRVPDIILLDILMPGGIDGYETCRRLKKLDKIKNIPVIFMSALTESVNKVRGFEAGAVDYVTKPIDADELLSRLKAHLTIKKLREKLEEANCLLEEKITLRTKELSDANRILKRLWEAVQKTGEAIIILDQMANITFVNPAFQLMTGYSVEEAVGRNIRILKSGRHSKAFYAELWDTLNAGKVWKGRFINKKKDGTLYHEESSISPFTDKSGTVVNYLAVKRDITRELKLEEQLNQSQKMDALGQMAGGVAHDFNNLLQIILGYTEMSLAHLPDDDAGTVRMKEIHCAAEQAVTLVRQLLTFSKRQQIEPQPLDLNETINNQIKLVGRLIGENIEVNVICPKETKRVFADPTQVEQILTNLCLNARDAMPQGGSLIIETRNTVMDESTIGVHTRVAPGEYVMLTVSDTGTGMPKEILEHIFEPFFSTKAEGKGSGLGLATVYGIVEKHKGMILVYSELSMGTTFKIYLPVCKAKTTPKPVVTEEHIDGGDETLLLAEDNAQVRKLAQRVLTKAGYNVLTAADGDEAVELFEKKHADVHLTIIDVVMPGKSGRVVYDRFKQLKPDVPVLFCSGYSFNSLETKFLPDREFEFISKPYKADVLLKKVRAILDDCKQEMEDTPADSPDDLRS